MKIDCAHDEIVDLVRIQRNPRNPNKHPERQIELLSKIIDYQGQRAPIIVSKRSGFIVKGHGRLMAIQKLGWDKAAVDYQDYESEAQEYADMVADNKISELAEHDDSMMVDDIKILGIEDLELLGLDWFEMPLEAQCDEDEVPEVVEPKAKLGDVYKLGDHRLMCGDATSIDAFDKLMNGEKADIVFTDPPYGMGFDMDYSRMGGFKPGIKHKQGLVDNFKPELIKAILDVGCDETFIFGADYFAEHLPNRNAGSFIVWDKRSNEDEIGKLDGAIGSSFELCWSKKKHVREITRFCRPISFYRGVEKSVHPTQKPVVLVEWFLNKYKGSVLDLFGGSGSTLIACEKKKTKCFMMELDPYYIDVIIARWEKYTGKTAELIK